MMNFYSGLLILLLALPGYAQAQFIKLKDKAAGATEQAAVSKPEETKPEAPAPEVAKPAELKPEEVKSIELKPEVIKPQEVKPTAPTAEAAKPEGSDVIKPAPVEEEPMGPATIMTTNEKGGKTSQSAAAPTATPDAVQPPAGKSKEKAAPKKDGESGEPLDPTSNKYAQQGCLGICKKYQEICLADTIYDEKDCREQWDACETGCLQL